EFRQDEFIDREKEIQYLKDWVDHVPKEILWLYGPKSTGKTTLIEYVIEKEWTSDLKIFDKYWIKYINFRGLMVGSYASFINSFFEEAEDQDDFSGEFKAGFNLGVIRLEAKLLERIKNNKKNLFNALIEKFKKLKKTKILIIDEIQTLESIYYNGEKELLKEFLNFCVRLTKETHLCHVILLSSNTIFIDRIYNDAKLKVTSEFYKIDHLDYATVKEWLLGKDLGFSFKDIDLIWDYLGGCIPLIQKLFRKRIYFDSLQQYLENEVKLAESEIIDLMRRFLTKKEKDIFKQIIKIIVDKGFFETGEEDSEVLVKVIDFMAEKEIFFYDPLTRKVTGNNRLYEKGFELVIGNLG
ncbi:MAG: ATP-binding protein, partial [Desulfonauticus sp.]|nr:ATP-binding protein [Desulfonauticus sp.]